MNNDEKNSDEMIPTPPPHLPDENPVVPEALVKHFDLLIQRLQMESEWLHRQSFDEQARYWSQTRTDLMKVRAFYKEYCLKSNW